MWIGLTKQKRLLYIGNSIFVSNQIVTKIHCMTSFINISLCRDPYNDCFFVTNMSKVLNDLLSQPREL